MSRCYTATILRTNSFDQMITGYGDIAGPFTVAVEFSAQGAVAGIKDADSVLRQLYALQRTDGPYAGAFPGATDHWYGGGLPAWTTKMPGSRQQHGCISLLAALIRYRRTRNQGYANSTHSYLYR